MTIQNPPSVAWLSRQFSFPGWVVALFLYLFSVSVASTSRTLLINRSLQADLNHAIQLPIGVDAPPLEEIVTSEANLIRAQGKLPSRAKRTYPMLLMVYSPTCGPCIETMEQWKFLVSIARREGYSTVLVDLSSSMNTASNWDSVAGTVDWHINQLTSSSTLAWKFRYTPQTAVIGPDNKVRGIWTGALSKNTQEACLTLLRQGQD